MDYNPSELQKDIRADFETMLHFVTSKDAQTVTAYQIERTFFRFLLSLGAQLLLLFFQMRSQACPRDKIVVENQTIPYHSEQKRVYFSIFGKIPLWRPYFYAAASGGHTPLDAELSLGANRYSDLLRETLNYVAVYVPYNKAVAIFQRFLSASLSTRVQQELVAEDAEDVLAYYEQKPAPKVADEAEILVIQADGKGVPIILEGESANPVRLGKGQKRGHKKEAVVTGVYTIATNPRTPQDVVNSFFQQPQAVAQSKTTPPRPQNKDIWATLDGKEAALRRLGQQVTPRLGSHIAHKVALADGCEALQERIKAQFPDFTLILDFVHANEYLWKVANSLLGESDESRTEWVKKQTELMLSGKTQQVIDDFRVRAKKKTRTKKQVEQLEKTANYFERNRGYMAYDDYLAKGYPIASGVIEGACRHFVKDRFELSGMRWEQKGAENLLRLRAIAENGDWDDYHLFHRQQCHQRLYGSVLPTHNAIEFLALDRASPIASPLASQPEDCSAMSTCLVQPASEQHALGVKDDERATSWDYYALPLVA